MSNRLQADNLKSLIGIHHHFFTREGGWSKDKYSSLNCAVAGDDNLTSTEENRKLVAGWMDVPSSHLLSLRQVHGAEVVTVTEAWGVSNRPAADAMVTRQRDLALGILTADCVPILFADEKHGVIGAAHAGWRGALAGIVENTVRAMEDLGARRETIHAALGACIWQDSYEVSAQFPAPFLEQDKTHKEFFRPSARAGHFMFDLPRYVTRQLERAGLASIAPSPADTFADEQRFYSYRRATLRGEGKAGSLISVIMLIGKGAATKPTSIESEVNTTLDALISTVASGI